MVANSSDNNVGNQMLMSQLKRLLESNCKIERIQPPVTASDAAVNIVIVTLLCSWRNINFQITIDGYLCLKYLK
jgi:hypothetical protein